MSLEYYIILKKHLVLVMLDCRALRSAGQEGVKSFRFIVSDLTSLTILAHLFNGNLFLKHRIEQLDK
jgi:hypothetical protein